MDFKGYMCVFMTKKSVYIVAEQCDLVSTGSLGLHTTSKLFLEMNAFIPVLDNPPPLLLPSPSIQVILICFYY